MSSKSTSKNKAAEAIQDDTQGAVEPSAAAPASVYRGTADASLSPGLRRLIELFATQLSDVAFPGISSGSLERASEELSARQQALETAKAQVAASEAALAASRDALRRLAERALAYARIYAAEDPELTQELSAIRLDPEKPKSTRGRKPRQVAQVEEALEIEPEASA